MKDVVTVGVVGAGRALELHAFGYKRSNIPCRLKTVVARRPEQISKAVEQYGFEKGSTDFNDLLNDPEIDRNKALSDAIDALNQYDLILFLEPDVEFVQDGDRSEVIRDDREKYSNEIKKLIMDHGKQFVTINGSYQERYEKAVKAVEEMLKKEDMNG